MAPTKGDGTAPKNDRWSAGVTPYTEMGYYDADYQPQDSDILVVRRDTLVGRVETAAFLNRGTLRATDGTSAERSRVTPH
jgi:hypothetical protein